MTNSDAPEPTTDGPIGRKLFPFPGVGSLGLAHGAAGLVVAKPTPALEGRPAGVRVRVFRIPQDAEDPNLGPCWAWRCQKQGCDQQGNGCLHQALHTPGSWAAAFCGGFQHVHRRHPRPGVPACEAFHTTLDGRRRCDWGQTTEAQRAFASYVLCGRTGYPGGPLAREVAREVLALAGSGYGPVLMSRVSGFPPLDGRGYLVISRGDLKPGALVAIGTMPRGVTGGVDDWTAGRIAEVDGASVPAPDAPLVCRYPECECERDSPCGVTS